MTVVAEAAAELGVPFAARRRPDVVVVDLEDGLDDALEAVVGIRKASPRTHVLIVLSAPTPPVQAALHDLGASACVPRDVPPERWPALVEAVLLDEPTRPVEEITPEKWAEIRRATSSSGSREGRS